jgi:hypothetical protein
MYLATPIDSSRISFSFLNSPHQKGPKRVVGVKQSSFYFRAFAAWVIDRGTQRYP